MLGRIIKYRSAGVLLKLPNGSILEAKWKAGFSLGEVVLVGIGKYSGELKDYYHLVDDVEPPEVEDSY